MRKTMRMQKLPFSRLCCAFLLGAAVEAHAVLVDWGTQAVTSVADCPSFCTDFTFGPVLGGVNVASSGVSSVSQPRGRAMASASLSGGLNTPVLRAESFANPNSNGAFATAFGVQAYTYNGPGETLVLDVILDGIVDDPEMDLLETNVSLEVVLYAPDPFGFYRDRGTLDFEVGANPLSQPDSSEASVQLQLDHTNPVNDSGRISVNVATGDEFYIWALMRAESESGVSNATFADAFNTGTMGFQNEADLNLVPAGSSVVPLPAAAWLFGSGLIGLIAIARRKAA